MVNVPPAAQTIIDRYKLIPHPAGTIYFTETYRTGCEPMTSKGLCILIQKNFTEFVSDRLTTNIDTYSNRQTKNVLLNEYLVTVITIG